MLKIFVGSESKTHVQYQVLRYSIESRTDMDVQVVEMGDFDPWIVPKNVHQATGFSLRRWMIPEECEFKGMAVYMDADQIVFGDVAELVSYTQTDNPVACCYEKDKCSQLLTGNKHEPVPQTSVMVINCELCDPKLWSRQSLFNSIASAGRPHTPKAVKEYQRVMHGCFTGTKPFPLDRQWNCFNRFNPNTKLLHYTVEPQQPWYDRSHHFASIWESELVKAIVSGYVTRDMLKESLDLMKKGSGDWRKFGGLDAYYSRYLDLAT